MYFTLPCLFSVISLFIKSLLCLRHKTTKRQGHNASPSERTQRGPIRRRVYGCLWGIVLSYPFRLFFLKICSIFPFVCSTTVASTATWLEGMTGEPRRVYSREPTSCIWESDKTSPTRTSLRRGTVRRSFGARRYFLPAIEAIAYWLGCERMRASAWEVDVGVCGLV